MMDGGHNPLPGIPHVESPLFSRWLEQSDLTDFERDVALQLHDKGFAVFDFPDPDFGAVANRMIEDLSKLPQFASIGDIAKGKPARPNTRLQDHVENEGVRRIAGNEVVVALLSKLYGRKAFPFQTLNFGTGTEQHYHSDSAHFSSVPERFMVGVWVALEDIGPEQGPLVYYPGSHKWPILHNDDVGNALSRPGSKRGQQIFEEAWTALIKANCVEPEYFHARKGQGLIWAANLLHGGMKQENLLKTRWSQVTHYFFEDCVYTTPMFSNPRLGRLALRNNVRNLVTGERVPNLYMGQPAAAEMTDRVENVPVHKYAYRKWRAWKAARRM